VDFPGVPVTTGYGMNAAADVTRTEFVHDFCAAHGYLFNRVNFTSFDFPGAKATWSTMIYDSGGIAGTDSAPIRG
jgi:hypothetical protein